MTEMKKRASNLNDLADGAVFYLRTRPIPMDDAAIRLLASAPAGLLQAVRDDFAGLNDWSADALDAAARRLAEAQGGSSARWRSRSARR